jgi:hypothetical protein
MAIRRFGNSSITSAGGKSSKFWDQETSLGTFESIASATTSGSDASITFSSIPQGYTQLQVRCLVRSASAATYGTTDTLAMYVNVDGSTTYPHHEVAGGDGSDGGTNFAGANTTLYSAVLGWMATSSSNTSVFSSHIVDVLNYTSTTQNKTLRIFSGYEDNRNNFGYGETRLGSALYKTNTNPITSLTFFVYSAANFAAYSQFSLYGIRSA